MPRIVIKNRKGFTILELLIAMLVLSIGMMGLLDGIANYVRINMENQMRQEAVRIAETTLETLRNARFDDVKLGTVVITTPEVRRIRNVDVNYAVNWTRFNVSTTSVAIQVIVSLNFRGRGLQHDAASIISTDI